MRNIARPVSSFANRLGHGRGRAVLAAALIAFLSLFGTTASAQMTKRPLQAPLLIRKKSNAVGGGSPPHSDAF